jgi:hypothetical protein
MPLNYGSMAAIPQYDFRRNVWLIGVVWKDVDYCRRTIERSAARAHDAGIEFERLCAGRLQRFVRPTLLGAKPDADEGPRIAKSATSQQR